MMWFGKIPSAGDFCHGDMPVELMDELDQWLSSCLLNGQRLFGETWNSVYFNASMLGFVWSAGTCSSTPRDAYAGVLMPSVDKAGRPYPLIVLSKVEPPIAQIIHSQSLLDWLEKVRQLCENILIEDWPREKVARNISELPPLEFVTDVERTLQAEHFGNVWYTLSEQGVCRQNILINGLPDAETLCRLYESEHATD